MAASQSPQTLLEKNFTSLKGIPFPVNPLNFFSSTRKYRTFLTVCETAQTWKNDLTLGEKLFADTIISVPYESADSANEIAVVKEILQKRMTYPGIKENPELLAIAKTWILSSKVHQGPRLSALQSFTDESSMRSVLAPLLQQITSQDENTLQCVKVELSEGRERMFLYQLLDNGYRPGLLLVKWSYDVDDHFATAQCAGHILNNGYTLARLENGYFLYVFRDQSIYDICSMKIPSMSNPIADTITQSAAEAVQSALCSIQSAVETGVATEVSETTVQNEQTSS